MEKTKKAKTKKKRMQEKKNNKAKRKEKKEYGKNTTEKRRLNKEHNAEIGLFTKPNGQRCNVEEPWRDPKQWH